MSPWFAGPAPVSRPADVVDALFTGERRGSEKGKNEESGHGQGQELLGQARPRSRDRCFPVLSHLPLLPSHRPICLGCRCLSSPCSVLPAKPSLGSAATAKHISGGSASQLFWR